MMLYHTTGAAMGKAKIAITLHEKIVGRIDRLVRQRAFSNRSQAIEEAVSEKLARLDKSRLAQESAKLDPTSERALAEEGLQEDRKLWPQF
jgi:Arc/MetJ-type ribon-helix-helix transcriptional regulator